MTTHNTESEIMTIDESLKSEIPKDYEISKYLYPVDSAMDYEISFMIKVINLKRNGKLCFGVEGFDKLKNKLNDAFITPSHSRITDMFAGNDSEEIPLDFFIPNRWYYVRGIIHAYSSTPTFNLISAVEI